MPEQPSTGAAAAADMLAEVAEGLGREQKELPPKYFYDTHGAALFDRITMLPEYYLTRVERELLAGFAVGWIGRAGARALVELGAGSAEKTRILLDAITMVRRRERVGAGAGRADFGASGGRGDATRKEGRGGRDAGGAAAGAGAPGAPWYVPVDISAAYLDALAASLEREYGARLEVHPIEADLTATLRLPAGTPRPAVFAFLGSTIGNFERDDATALLRRVRTAMREDDHFLMGADLRKERAILEAAYNDAQGVTAEFNLNILRVLNRELDADFDLDAYEHRAFYDAERGRIEMHLVARAPQIVLVPGAGQFDIAAGETIRTEISCKYDRAAVESLFAAAGLELEQWVTEAGRRYALAVGRRARGST